METENKQIQYNIHYTEGRSLWQGRQIPGILKKEKTANQHMICQWSFNMSTKI